MFDEFNKKPFAILYNHYCKYVFKNKVSIFIFQVYDFEHGNKYDVLKNFLDNPCQRTNEKMQLVDLFRKTQAVLNTFRKFYNNHSAKKAICYDCTTDLDLEPLYLIKDKLKFKFIQDNTLFTFTNKDLLKIISNSLLHHDNFFADALFPKNPYTNVKISKTILYNFYFYLLKNNFRIPEVFRRFYYCNFDLNVFMRKHDSYIRETSIDNYHKQISMKQHYEEIILFLRSIQIDCIYIHIDFPKKSVIDAFSKIYRHHLHSRFDLSADNRRYHCRKFRSLLNEFMNKNKTFGRIIHKRGEKLCEHNHYKFKNLLCSLIPNFQSLDSIYKYMEKGEHIFDDDDDDDDVLRQQRSRSVSPSAIPTLESVPETAPQPQPQPQRTPAPALLYAFNNDVHYEPEEDDDELDDDEEDDFNDNDIITDTDTDIEID